MKKFFVITMMACAAVSVQAQEGSRSSQNSVSGYCKTHNVFQHLDISVNAGTSGIGFDVATPIGNYVQLRAGYEFMPHFHYSVNFPVEVGGEP